MNKHTVICTCHVCRFGDALREEVTNEIFFCPMHEAAPDMYDLLKAAVARIELANAEGNNIMAAWLPDALAAISKAEGG